MKKFLMLAVLFSFSFAVIGCGSPAPPASKDKGKDDKGKDAKGKDDKGKDDKGKDDKPAPKEDDKPKDPPKEDDKPKDPPKDKDVEKEAKNDEPKPKLDPVKVENLKLE